jgi:hypothetical protein
VSCGVKRSGAVNALCHASPSYSTSACLGVTARAGWRKRTRKSQDGCS